MKPKRKPMFTTLLFCLTANQAVETQIPALETTTVQISFSIRNEMETQKNNLILINDFKEEEEKTKYLTNGISKKPEKDPPLIEVEDPIPKCSKVKLLAQIYKTQTLKSLSLFFT